MLSWIFNPNLFKSGSTYEHDADGGNVPQATWEDNTICILTHRANTRSDQSFYDLTINTINNASGNPEFGNNVNVRNNLIIERTGGTLRFANEDVRTLTVKNFEMSGGTFDLARNTNTGTGNLLVSGNFSHTGGTISESSTSISSAGNITFNGSSTQNFTSGGTVSNTINYTVNSGAILQIASGSTVTGGGAFTLSAGATLGITSADGITSSGASGSVQVTGTRTFNSTSSYIYNGGVTQSFGNGFPATVANLTITGFGTSMSLLSNEAITGNLTVGAGSIFNLQGFLANRSTSGGTISIQGRLIIGATRTFPTNYSTRNFDDGTVEYNGGAQSVPVFSYNNLVLSGTGFKTFGSGPMTIQGNFTISGSATTSVPNGTDFNVGNFITSVGAQPAGVYSGTSASAPATRLVGTRTVSVTRVTTAVSGTPILGSTTTGLIISNAAALPVTLTSFTAKPTPDNKVSLGWVTSTEQVNKGFRIERQSGSTTGKYEQIGFVGSKAKDGNSQNTLTYNFIDAAPKVGVASFYRLVQEDLDGKLTYTEVRIVKLNGQSVSMVFPNSSNGAVNISRTADGKKMNIQVIDQSGRIIRQANNITDANYRMNISQSGIYSIKMMYPETGEQSIQRVVVQK